MRFANVSILAVAHVDAPHRISSAAIDDRLAPAFARLGVQPGLLASLSGINARRFWDEGVQPSDAATLAAEKVLAKTGLDRHKLGILINTSVCRDYVEPSTACLVHGNLGLPATCLNFDIANACLGFINGMTVVGNMIERGQIDYGIVVDGEGSRFVIEKTIERLLAPDVDEKTFRGSFASLTLGSGAAAMILARSDLAPEGHRFLGGVDRAATQHNRLCLGQVDWMKTKTKELLLAGLQLANETWMVAKEELNWSDAVLDELVLHQVSRVHTEQLAALLGLSLAKIHTIYPEYGNIGPASVPIVLSQAEELGRLGPGKRVALMGIGSGLNVSMAEVVW